MFGFKMLNYPLFLLLKSSTFFAFNSTLRTIFFVWMQGFTYPVKVHFLEDILQVTGYKITSFNQIDDYGQEKLWKTQRQLAPRKRKNNITTLVEVGDVICAPMARANNIF